MILNIKTKKMEENWTNIFSSDKVYKIDILQEVLSENNIESRIINKKDSTILLGEIELYVKPEDIIKAKDIIKKHPNL